ncbi:MAG: winged helix-turn-helix transcriptional regulator [Anaerolineae bacterium]|nr:winged helix-turn-helix transcriptional regulator [Anaerolineae bacterium]
MENSQNKTRKLVEIAQMYYEKNMTQNEISEKLGVSRPLVSRMLNEAREMGIVTIQVHSPETGSISLLNQLRNVYNLRDGIIITDSSSENSTNQTIAANILDFVLKMNPPVSYIGLGWGYVIGMLTQFLEKSEAQQQLNASVFPLIGNSPVSNRDYHSNEIVRIFAEKTGAGGLYLHAPAFLETEQEKRLFEELENYKKVENAWDLMDTAVVNLGNYPSVPDYATATRFGDLLNTRKAAGRMLCYYFDIHGDIIHSDSDYTIQIPIEKLARCRNVVAVCSVALQPKAIVGALRTGLITHIIATESAARQVLEFK